MRGGFARRRPLLRAAVVGGGAYMAGRAAANRSAQQADQEAYQDQRLSDLEQAQQQPPAQQYQAQQPQYQQQAPVPEQGPDSSMLGQLNQLVQLHDAGALNDAEFAAAKAKLLG
jgi:hypothetical protein